MAITDGPSWGSLLNALVKLGGVMLGETPAVLRRMAGAVAYDPKSRIGSPSQSPNKREKHLRTRSRIITACL
jgi:hypothetical protein